jgi:hypothetical protein
MLTVGKAAEFLSYYEIAGSAIEHTLVTREQIVPTFITSPMIEVLA